MSHSALNRREFLSRSLAAGSTAAFQARRASGRTTPAAGGLRAGAAMSNITPSLGCSLAGGMTDRTAAEVHDELHVRSLVLDNGETRLAFAIVDSCMVPGDVIAAAKALIHRHTQIPVNNILISATHTHSAPPALHLFQSKPDPNYVEWMKVRISDCVRMAANRLAPARIGWGVGREESQVFNRRWFLKSGTIPPDPFGNTTDTVQMNPGVGNPNLVKPAGPTDPDVGVLAVESPDGRPICVLGNYALHYVGGTGGNNVSADYFGVWADSMARFAGAGNSRAYPPFVAMLTNGCSANINNINFGAGARKRYPPFVKMQQVADVVAAEAYRTWRTMRFHDSVELNASVEELELGVRLPTPEEVATARGILADAPKTGQLKKRPQIYARETLIMAETFPRSYKAPVQALRVGSLGIVTFPVEAFVELGLEVKAKSPFETNIAIELANGCYGYALTVEAHKQGGYETWRAKSSYLEVEAAPKLVAAALRRLRSVAG